MPFISMKMKGFPMTPFNRVSFLILFFLALSLQPFLAQGGDVTGKKAAKSHDLSSVSPAEPAPQYPSMQSPGKKVSIDKDHYLIYGFDKKPKLGTVIMKLEIYTQDGKKDTSFEVLGDSGMPSMKGAHETGEQLFRLSNKGAYLLPVNIVMPGDWEIRITIKKGGKVVFRGSHQFDV
ncbi:MAG: hypothetical protein A2X58_02915 [Nitrospirae bacterium GWC2_56_14]|nr:MAG: hypothetical protein A2X58_02915 [Nitrospirae bacterium GWC2_56_14]